MYKSPIELIVSDWHNQLIEQQENQIYQAICSAGVKVDKDELVKALMYDRNQYEKGYMDGARAFAEMLKTYYREAKFAYEADCICEEIDHVLKGLESKYARDIV